MYSNTITGNAAGIRVSNSNDNIIYNNYFNNKDGNNAWASGGTGNAWNTALTAGTNIIGGSFLGGNYWANPYGNGKSQTCSNRGDGICDSAYTIAPGHIDNLPLTNNPVPPPPVAAFSASTPTSGNAPLEVTFQDQSLGPNSPIGWAWFFGDEDYMTPWTQLPEAGWSSRCDHTGVAMPDGSIVLLGGYDGILKNDVWRSTDNGATWTQVNASSGWSPRSDFSSVATPDGTIVVMGGTGLTNDVWRSTNFGATWTQLPAAAWSGRNEHSSVAMPDGSIVLMGGWDGFNAKNDVWRSTDKGATWELKTASAGWSGRSDHSSVAMPDGSIIVMGGYDGILKNDVWRSTDNGQTWELRTANAGWAPRAEFGSVAMPDGSIIVMGGAGWNDVWRSTDNGATWTRLTYYAGWTPRHLFSAVATRDGSIVLMGGDDNTPTLKNDVWRFMPMGSSAQNPSHTYTTPGIYQVALQAYNAGGFNSIQKAGYITVTAPTPTVTGIIPPTGINTGTVSITNLAGTNFVNGATVMLTPSDANPVHKGSISHGGGALLSDPNDVYVSGKYAYVTSPIDNALEIVDVTDPANPVHMGSINYDEDDPGGALLSGPMSVYVSGKYAYVVSFVSGALEIVDVTDPAHPMHKGSISHGDGGAILFAPIGVYVSGNHAYVASYGSDALEIVDVTDPAHPVHKGSIVDGTGGALLSGPYGIYVSGNYAYVTSSYSDALEIVDVTDPAHPVHKGSIVDGTGGALLSGPYGIYVSGNYAYVVSYGNDALEIVDVTDPAHPVHKGSIVDGAGGALLDYPYDVYVSGNYAYVASFNSGALEIVDVTDPAHPVHKGSIMDGNGGALLSGPTAIYVSGDYAYVADAYSDALEIVDLGTVTATGVNVVSPTQITGTFDLTDKIAGPYNVVVTNLGGKFGTLESGFTVTALPVPDLIVELVENSVLGGNPDEKPVYASVGKVPANMIASQWGTRLERRDVQLPATRGWFFLIDDNPDANWEHPVTYVHVDDSTAPPTITTYPASTPPTNIKISKVRGKSPNAIGGGGGGGSTCGLSGGSSACSPQYCTNCYALLISGGYDPANNNIRYWNDMACMYTTLRQKYCYPEDHIYVLMSDGDNPAADRYTGLPDTPYDNSPTNLDGSGRVNDVYGAATRQNVEDTLNVLKGQLGTDDHLFIFTTNHGGKEDNGERVRLWLWSGEFYWDDEFTALLEGFQSKAITMTMEQCYSGGFVDDFMNSAPQTRVIATAANAVEPSWGNDFSYAWIYGVAGPANTPPIGDGNPLISLRESYVYALNNDPSAMGSDPLEHPQYSDVQGTGSGYGLSSCAKCPAPKALPDGIMPTDTNRDGIYEDLNSNQVFDIADVVLYFNNMEWIAANEPVCAFDTNGNGRIDFADVVNLYWGVH